MKKPNLRSTPRLFEFQRALQDITPSDIEYAASNSAPLGENERLLDIDLSPTVESGTSEAVRAYVLMASICSEWGELFNSEDPEEIALAAILQEEMTMCESHYVICIRALAYEYGVELSYNETVGIIFQNGDFRATAIEEEIVVELEEAPAELPTEGEVEGEPDEPVQTDTPDRSKFN